MNDPNPAVCARVATAIEKLHDPKFTPNLLTALIDESLLVRQAILQSLGQIGATAAIPEGEVYKEMFVLNPTIHTYVEPEEETDD
jgi:HEAT repeats